MINSIFSGLNKSEGAASIAFNFKCEDKKRKKNYYLLPYIDESRNEFHVDGTMPTKVFLVASCTSKSF